MADRKIRQDDSILMHIHNPADGPVLPKEGQRNVLVTSALPCESPAAPGLIQADSQT